MTPREFQKTVGLRIAVGRTDFYVRWPWDWGYWTNLSTLPRFGFGVWIERGWR